MKVYMLGAGASKAYGNSPTGCKMPLANELFKIMNKLKIIEEPWFHIGKLVHYMDYYHHINPFEMYNFDRDIEVVYTEIEQRLKESIVNDNFEDILKSSSAYNNLIFILTSIINEIQNGPISKTHLNFVNFLSPEDTIITFNWDTLIDRSLSRTNKWFTDTGYGVRPQKIYKDSWDISDSNKKSDYKLLKLHGSTNWLTSYRTFDLEKKRFDFTHTSDKSNFYVYENTISPYPCYDGRYMDGYAPFSYGYYPPNIPEMDKEAPDGFIKVELHLRTPHCPKGKNSNKLLESMPIIIKPVNDKSYSAYGSLFKELWEEAEAQIIKAEEIIIIGYSFPLTDSKTTELFRNAFKKRKTFPRIIIVNPQPEQIEQKFQFQFGIPKSMINVIRKYVNEDFDFNFNK